MRHIFLFTAAAAFVFAAPAGATPGNGHGNGHGYGLGFERPQQEHDWSAHYPVGYGVGGCPPGLAKKHNGCMPPGQAKRSDRSPHLADLLGSLSHHHRH
jgi:hypothetical protein